MIASLLAGNLGNKVRHSPGSHGIEEITRVIDELTWGPKYRQNRKETNQEQTGR